MTDKLLNEIIALSDMFGPSGLEDEVTSYIRSKLEKYSDTVYQTPIGGVGVFFKGNSQDKRVVISAPTDETSFMISDIDDDGYVRIKGLARISPAFVSGHEVTLGNEENKADGIIASKVLHMTKGDESKRPAFDKMFISVGAEKGDELKELFNKGDLITFKANAKVFNEKYIMGKALDSRVPCALLLELAERISLGEITPKYDTVLFFSVKDKVGASDTFTAVRKHAADSLVLLTAAPVLGSGDSLSLGKGVVLPSHDGRCLYFSSPLYKELISCDIKHQIPEKTSSPMSSSSAGLISQGAATVNISLPCMNMLSGNETVNTEDIESMQKMLEYII